MSGTLEDGLEPAPLPNIKPLFRTRYSLDLSETALGYAKIKELQADAQLSGICTVDLRDSGYVVVPSASKTPDSGKCPAPDEPDPPDAGTPTGSPVSHPPTPP